MLVVPPPPDLDELAAPAQPEPAANKPRRGATAMEYLVVISFILVVLITAIQQLGGFTGSTFQKDAEATSFMGGDAGKSGGKGKGKGKS